MFKLVAKALCRAEIDRLCEGAGWFMVGGALDGAAEQPLSLKGVPPELVPILESVYNKIEDFAFSRETPTEDLRWVFAHTAMLLSCRRHSPHNLDAVIPADRRKGLSGEQVLKDTVREKLGTLAEIAGNTPAWRDSCDRSLALYWLQLERRPVKNCYKLALRALPAFDILDNGERMTFSEAALRQMHRSGTTALRNVTVTHFDYIWQNLENLAGPQRPFHPPLDGVADLNR